MLIYFLTDLVQFNFLADIIALNFKLETVPIARIKLAVLSFLSLYRRIILKKNKNIINIKDFNIF